MPGSGKEQARDVRQHDGGATGGYHYTVDREREREVT